MFAFVRAFLCVFVVAQFLVPGAARAQSDQSSYARLLTANEIQQVLHCPLCNYPASDRRAYFVRTAEDLNVAFADYGIAVNVVELLNVMAEAQSQCDRTGYDLAFDEYAIVIGMGNQEATQERAEIGGVFRLLCPRRDWSSLARHVVPPFYPCGGHRFAAEKEPAAPSEWN